jgi:PAS domain S-box-containing protein
MQLSSRLVLSGVQPQSTEHAFTPQQVRDVMDVIYQRGDSIVKKFILAHVVLALFLATFYDTWPITLVVGGAAAAMFFLSATLLPRSAITRCMAGISLQIFVALHIYQMHGLAEMHFLFFTGFTMMIVYQDWKSMWPGAILIIAQHTLFAVLTNYGVGLYFFEDSYIGSTKLMFHFGFALMQVAICGYWAFLLRCVTLRDAWQRTELQKTMQLQQAILDSANYAILSTKADGVIQTFNAAAEKWLKYSAAEVVGQADTLMLHDKNEVAQRARQISEELGKEIQPDSEVLFARARSGAVETGEWTYFRKDGTMFPVQLSVTALRDAANNLTGFLFIADDITQRKHAEAEIQLQKSLLEAQSEASIDGIVFVDEAGKILSFNRRFVEMWDIPQEVINAGSNEAAVQAVLGKVANAEAFLARIAYLNEHPDESSYDEVHLMDGYVFERYSTSIKGDDGSHYGRVWFFRDITARRQTEAALLQAKEEAERANAAKSEFLSRMSHELRTPMNAILGFGQLLQMDDLSTDQRDSVNHILKGGKHLLGLINEVLDITRVEAGKMETSLEPVLVDQVLAESLDLVQPLARRRNIRLNGITAQQGSEYVMADEKRLRQVLLNLLSNAVKYNTTGGQVSVQCARSAEGRVRISVTDTGTGIAPEDLPKLFVPFERLGAAHTQIEGTGLGLVFSKRLMEAQNGTLSVHSVVGQGSTFFLELPLAQPPVQPLAAETPENKSNDQAPPAPPRTILSIEDNAANSQLIQRILERSPNIHLLSAMQGVNGLALARQHRPDLVLLDIHLPDINGDEVLKRLQEDASTAHIPVVIVSADATEKQVERLMSAGATHYLSKPINVKELLSIIDQIVHPASDSVPRLWN